MGYSGFLSLFLPIAAPLLIAGTVLVFMGRKWALALTFAGLVAARIVFGRYVDLPSGDTVMSLIFWGIASAIAVGINYMLPRRIGSSRAGLGYMAGGALVGAIVGLAVSHAWMIVGSVAGAILGGVAWAKTPSGRQAEFPSSRFLNYLCAKGLPAVVNMCLLGTAVELLAQAMILSST